MIVNRERTVNRHLFSNRVFSLFADRSAISRSARRKTEKRKAKGPRKGRSQLESVTVGADLPRLSCKSRSRWMAARTGWVPRCK